MQRSVSRLGMIVVVGCVLLATVWIGLPVSAQSQSISQMCGSDKLLFTYFPYQPKMEQAIGEVYILDMTTGMRQRISDPTKSTSAYAWFSNGEVALVVWQGDARQILIGNPEKLPSEPRATMQITRPIAGLNWSPDGQYLAFTERQGRADERPSYKIISMNLKTGAEQLLTDPAISAFSPQWSPLSTEIVVERSVGGGTYHIYLVSADGTTTRKLVSHYGGYYPAWSPDGQMIAYRPDGKQIFLMNRDGSNKHPLLKENSSAALTLKNVDTRYPVWSPNGKCIVIHADGLYIVNTEGTQAQRLSGTDGYEAGGVYWQPNEQAKRQLLFPTPTTIPNFPNPRLSQLTGKIIFASKRNGREDVYVMDANGTNERRLTNTGSKNTIPKLSPDGKRIAFLSDRDGQDHIYTMNIDGSDQKRLAVGENWEAGPGWTPEGQPKYLPQPVLIRREAYYSAAINLDGSQQSRDTLWWYPTVVWSPTGNFYLWTYAGAIGICTKEVKKFEDRAGKCQSLNTNPQVYDYLPAWSPDETQIAFVSERDELENIYIMNRDGSNQKPLTFSNFVSTMPTWSPDGKYIAFVSERDGQPQIYIMDRRGVLLGRLTSNNGSNLYPTWIK